VESETEPPLARRDKGGVFWTQLARASFGTKFAALEAKRLPEGGMSRGKNLVFAGSLDVSLVFSGIRKRDDHEIKRILAQENG
jgi:hypothetical protein